MSAKISDDTQIENHPMNVMSTRSSSLVYANLHSPPSRVVWS